MSFILGIVDSYIEVTSTSGPYAGGIVGYASNSAITNCYNTGSVTAKTTSGNSGANAGGVVGYAYSSTITDCYNTGSVTATASSSSSSAYAYVGGIVGYTDSTTITDCYNTGSVTATSPSSSSYAYAYAGGIVGAAYRSTITNCYNTGSIAAATSSAAYAYAGGIVGRAFGSTTTNCYNTGSVTATATSSSAYAYAYAGGVEGYAYSSTITDCYNTGSVTATATSPSSSSYAYVGGIVGYAYSNTTITDCYNTGSISASDYAGGIVGYVDSSTITNCYYLNIISKGVGYGKDTATACTAEQMKKQETFADFDFETVWTMDPAGEYPLPTLRSVVHVESEEDTVNFAGGNGSIANPYRIATKEHLNNVRNHPGFFFELVADIAFTEADFAEDGAFYNDGIGWQPIGTYSAPFNGYFDGNGHTIKGLQINIFGSSTVYAGLFGYVKNCTIRNLVQRTKSK